MNIIVLLHQVPDLVEEPEVNSAGTGLEYDGLRHVLNEYDGHALEQALLLKEELGGRVTGLAPASPDVDETLFAAYARGADECLRIAGPTHPLSSHAAAAVFAAALQSLSWDLILTGVQGVDQMDGSVGALLSVSLGVPYVGVVRGVRPDAGGVVIGKEYPGGVLGEMRIALPAVLGIQAATQPPRYVPIMRIRQAMKTQTIREIGIVADGKAESGLRIRSMARAPEPEGARMLAGNTAEIAQQIADLLHERGIA